MSTLKEAHLNIKVDGLRSFILIFISPVGESEKAGDCTSLRISVPKGFPLLSLTNTLALNSSIFVFLAHMFILGFIPERISKPLTNHIVYKWK